MYLTSTACCFLYSSFESPRIKAPQFINGSLWLLAFILVLVSTQETRICIAKSVNTTNSVTVMILNKAYSGLTCVIFLN